MEQKAAYREGVGREYPRKPSIKTVTKTKCASLQLNFDIICFVALQWGDL